jgi:hypothetical protein
MADEQLTKFLAELLNSDILLEQFKNDATRPALINGSDIDPLDKPGFVDRNGEKMAAAIGNNQSSQGSGGFVMANTLAKEATRLAKESARDAKASARKAQDSARLAAASVKTARQAAKTARKTAKKASKRR